jgi:hypothetical protein
MIKNDSIGTTSNRGVGYYNIDNIDNTYNKDNLENVLNEKDDPFLLSERNDHVPSRGHSAAKPVSQCVSEQPTPLFSTLVKSCVVNLFYNENSAQKYKLKIKFNLIDHTNPEFIASLTQDRRNFVKYIPESHRESIIEYVDTNKAELKKYNIKPYIGKLHLYDPCVKTERNEIQPDTAVLVWYSSYEDNKGWSTLIKFMDLELPLDLFEEYLTPKQKNAGVIGQSSWQNPAYMQPRSKIWTFGGTK